MCSYYQICIRQSSLFLLGRIKRTAFLSRLSENVKMSDGIYENNLTHVDSHWGNSIRKIFFNSNGVSLKIEESSTHPIVMSLDHGDIMGIMPGHDGLCIGVR